LRPEGTATAAITTSTTIISNIIIIKTAVLTKLSPNLGLCTLEIIHTHIPWIGKCVIKKIGCGTSQIPKYAKLQCKILQNILQKQYYKFI
jgi:hypothetical protein